MGRFASGQGRNEVSLAEFKSFATPAFRESELTCSGCLNKDGKVRAAITPTLTAFDRADANKDGKVTLDEAKKASGR